MYRFAPRRYKNFLEENLKMAGSRRRADRFFNNIFALSLAVGFLVAIFVMKYFLIIWPIVFLAVFALFHGFVMLAVDRRSKFVEKMLPDALQLMAANSRAGYIPSRALLLSARPEFGPLSVALKNVGKQVLTGKSLEEGLNELTETVRSDLLDRTKRLIKEGIRAGGHFASLLEENAINIRKKEAIRKEVSAHIMMYTIFVGFAGSLGAPILYALSSYLMDVMGQFSKVARPEAFAKVPFLQFGQVSISGEFMFMFSISAILITTVFGSMLIGLISQGKEKAGIRYIPVMVTIGLTAFFVTQFVVINVLGITF